MSQSRSRRSGSCSMISRAFSAAAAAGGVIDALKTSARALCLIQLMTSAGPAMTPPIDASDLENVVMMRSTSSWTPKCSPVPLPPGPMTPNPWASSTMSRAPYFRFSSAMAGRFARSPSME